VCPPIEALIGSAIHLRLEVDHAADDGSGALDDDDQDLTDNILTELRILR
jgi:hypothetical protein